VWTADARGNDRWNASARLQHRRAARRMRLRGEVAERSNAAVLKTVEPKGSGGSNPSLSATYRGTARVSGLFGLLSPTSSTTNGRARILPMKTREQIGNGLYELSAGADPDLFLRVLRTYVVQHAANSEQIVELLKDLAKAHPEA